MRGLTASDLIEVWDRGQSRSPTERALLLLRASEPDADPDRLAGLPIGVRDHLLFALRERTFGSRVTGVTPCSACGERLEVSMDLADVTSPPSLSQPEPDSWTEFELNGYRVRFRAPDSRDLLALEILNDPVRARRTLIQRCVVAFRNGRRRSPDRLPAAVLARVASEMSEADPQAVTDITVTCPGCGRRQTILFDIVSFLWGEVGMWAPRILEEVHALASAYGWDEERILDMSHWRRRAYLDLVVT